MSRFLKYFLSSALITVIGAVLVVVNVEIALILLLIGLLGLLLTLVILIQWLLESEKMLRNDSYLHNSPMDSVH